MKWLESMAGKYKHQRAQCNVGLFIAIFTVVSFQRRVDPSFIIYVPVLLRSTSTRQPKAYQKRAHRQRQ
jgi:hypothetical protein